MSNLASLITELANTISALIDADAKNTAATSVATNALIASKDAIITDLQNQQAASETEIANADSALADLLVKARNAVAAATTVTTSPVPVSDTLVESVAEVPAIAG
jgi:hypothetical protein